VLVLTSFLVLLCIAPNSLEHDGLVLSIISIGKCNFHLNNMMRPKRYFTIVWYRGDLFWCCSLVILNY